MSADLERRYRLLLVAFPRRYRAERGEEMLTTLIEAAAPGQRWPGPGDVADLARHAARLRLGVRRLPADGVLARAAGAGLSLSAALCLVAMVFGELPVWGRDPGLNPNQFGYGPFETTGVYAYGLVLGAWLCFLVGRPRASRGLAIMACLAALACYARADVLQGRPNVTVLATLVVCLGPLVLSRDVPPRQRLAVGVVPVASLLLGATVFAGLPTGHPDHWDPRAVFYTDRLGLVGRLHPVVLLVALIMLALAAATAVRLRRRDLWSASTLVLIPALVIAFGGGPAGGGMQGRAQDNAPFVEMTAVIAAVGVAEVVLARRRQQTSDSRPGMRSAVDKGGR